jgi:hypothetical protein
LGIQVKVLEYLSLTPVHFSYTEAAFFSKSHQQVGYCPVGGCIAKNWWIIMKENW